MRFERGCLRSGAALLAALLLLGGCGSTSRLLGRVGSAQDMSQVFAPSNAEVAAAARSSLAADPRIEQAPLDADSKEFARKYFALPNPKAFAFSPERGTNRHSWGQPSVEVATRTSLSQCEEFAGSPCELFAINDEIVWRPGRGAPAGASPMAAAVAAPAVAAAPVAAADAAGASAYLVGVFDLREGRTTLLQVVNPTGADLRLFTAFFDGDQRPLACVGNRLAANDVLEIDVRRAGVAAPFGSVKVMSLAEGEGRPQAGVVGRQRLSVAERTLSETALHPVQASLLEDQLPALAPLCRW